jgi:two-component system, OmpR family, sensor histidine kinase KdpD
MNPSIARSAVAVATSLAAVAVVTGAIFGFRSAVPVLSLGVLYVFAVLPVAIFWGRTYAVVTAIASMLAFNFFFLPPRHTFRLEDSANWFALAVYLVTAVVVSDLAAHSRRRAAEAEQREQEEALLAELSIALLHGQDVAIELERAAPAIASTLGADRVQVVLGQERPAAEGAAFPLTTGPRRVGTLYVEGPPSANAAVRRFLPALASLLAVAVDREQLEREALQAESLRLSDAMKTAILRAVSHDLRSPLTAIRVAAESLVSPSVHLDEEARRRQLETVRAESRRLDRLVANLLDLSRLQAGAAAPQRELVSVDELVGRALAEVPRDADRVEVVLPDEMPLVEVDAVQLERTLVNLLDNALRFTPPDGGVVVEVEGVEGDVAIGVSDDGPGISEGEVDRVFEPFARLGGDDERRGAGLGLAIARGFAESNGGRIQVESEAGKGTRFTVVLPRAAVSLGVEP